MIIINKESKSFEQWKQDLIARGPSNKLQLAMLARFLKQHILTGNWNQIDSQIIGCIKQNVPSDGVTWDMRVE